jgi:hypothetical protein
VIGRPVARVRLKTVDSPRDLGARRDRGGPELQVFMPRIISKPGDTAKRPPQLKVRPDGPKDGGRTFTGFPKGRSEDPIKKDGAGPQPRVIQPPSGDQPQRFKQTTTPPPTVGREPPPYVQKQPLKQAPPPGPGQSDPNAYRKSGPPPSGFKGQDVRPRDGGSNAPRVQQVPRQEFKTQGKPPPKKDDKTGGEVK